MVLHAPVQKQAWVPLRIAGHSMRGMLLNFLSLSVLTVVREHPLPFG